MLHSRIFLIEKRLREQLSQYLASLMNKQDRFSKALPKEKYWYCREASFRLACLWYLPMSWNMRRQTWPSLRSANHIKCSWNRNSIRDSSFTNAENAAVSHFYYEAGKFFSQQVITKWIFIMLMESFNRTQGWLLMWAAIFRDFVLSLLFLQQKNTEI